MALSWNEIKDRAIKFSKEWEAETQEHAEAKSFWDGFFNVFGITRRRVASFEVPVKKLGDKKGFIDLFWKGTLIVEHKSKGKDLNKAYEQAIDYFPGIKEIDLPKYILVSDFSKFKLYDLEENTQYECLLSDLYKNIKLFGFITGLQIRKFKSEDPVNIKAAELMGLLHDELKEIGYKGHNLEVYLVRILFCLFADDTSIFEKNLFFEYIENKTNEDGSNLANCVAELFQVLNTKPEDRLKNLDETLNQFPYVNGKLFEETLPIASFNKRMREQLLKCCSLDWGSISPAIFGSLFQSIMDKEARRNLGAHYTSEKSILKLIHALFLDELSEEFEKSKSNKNKLKEFHQKITSLKFLDPACGCGNFLIIAYRELRLLELKIIKEHHKGELVLNIAELIKINIEQFFGIEIEEFPAKIAEVAMWLIDHQMNMIASEEFGQYFIRLPLEKSAKILNDNALQINWNDIILPNDLNYILGNPPFIGKQHRDLKQNKDMDEIFNQRKGCGILDYVTAWYMKAAEYIQNTNIKVGFGSTNSITQGEQDGILWNELKKYNINISFAHRTIS